MTQFAPYLLIILFPAGIILAIVFAVKAAKNSDPRTKTKYKRIAITSLIASFVLPFLLAPLLSFIRPRYTGQIQIHQISSLPDIHDPQVLHPAPDSNIAAQIGESKSMTTYADTLGSLYVINTVSGAPFWQCKVYYVQEETVRPVDAPLNTVGCGSLNTDGKGNWYLVNRSTIYPDSQTSVYKLENGKALYVPGFENMKALNLSYDSTTDKWYGQTTTAISIPDNNSSDEATAFYQIDFGTAK